MSNLSENSFVKINPSVFPEGCKPDDMVGELGYLGLFQHLTWRITKVENDSARGMIAHAEIINPDILLTIVPGAKKIVSEGAAVLLMKDLVPANMKTTVDYTVVEDPTAGNDAAIAALLKARKKMQNQGKTKEDSNMKKNWKEITKLRAESQSSTVKVLLPKKNIAFTLNKSELPTDDEKSIETFKQLLASKLRGMRNDRKYSKKTESTVDVFGIAVRKSGGVFLEEGSLLKAYEESLKTSLETPKKPIDPKANYVGVEIEFIYRGDYKALKDLLIKEKLHRYVDLTSDGSLSACHNSGYSTLEMRVICKNTEISMVMSKLKKVMAHPKIDAYVNRSCGLHVHTDMRNRDVKLAYRNFVRIQNLLRGAQPVGRVNNKHCKANTSDVFTPGENGVDGRYSVVNSQSFKKHQTLEIRIHEGTVNCDDIANWVLFIDSIASYAAEIPVNKLLTARALVSAYPITIPVASVEYVDNRIEKFDSLNAG